MSKQPTKICLGCMKYMSSENGICEKCGFNPQSYNVNLRCLKLGTVLNKKYVVGRVLGEGGFGITYIGWNLLLEMPVAIKEYFPHEIASRDGTTSDLSIHLSTKESFENGMRRLLNEARTMSKMDSNSGIVSIHDFFNENNTAYIIMEYVEGCTLKDYLNKYGAMDCKQVLTIMKPVMEALDKMHSLNMIHRDISPDNIMIRSDGQVKLIDFGATRIVEEDEDASLTVVLKRGFAPEEQYRSKGKQGSWTDVYALCATIYYMITGSVVPEAIDRLVEDKYVPIGETGKSVSKGIAEAIDAGLAVKAVDRIQSMHELICRLYGNKNVKGTKQRPVKQVEQSNPKGKKNKIVFIGIIVAVLIIAGVIIVKIVSGNKGASTTVEIVDVPKASSTPAATSVASPKPTAYVKATPVADKSKEDNMDSETDSDKENKPKKKDKSKSVTKPKTKTTTKSKSSSGTDANAENKPDSNEDYDVNADNNAETDDNLKSETDESEEVDKKPNNESSGDNTDIDSIETNNNENEESI